MSNKFRSLYYCLIYVSILFSHITVYSVDSNFVSLKFNEVNARIGPGRQYPIIWVYKRKFLPLKLLDQYDNWRQIQDINGEVSWIHVSNLSRSRSIIITDPNGKTLYVKPNIGSAKIAILKNNVQCMLKKHTANWCKLDCDGIVGWTRSVNLWGV